MVELTIPFLGTLPGWITALTSSGTFAAVATIWLKSRKLKIAENQDDRDGYGDVIRVLREEVARLGERERACEERLLKVEDELRGVHRKLIDFQIDQAKSMPSERLPKDIADMVERIPNIIRPKGE